MQLVRFSRSSCRLLSASAKKLFMAILIATPNFAFADAINSTQPDQTVDKTARTSQYIIQVVQNEVMGLFPGEFISQKEQQEIIRFIFADELNFQNLFEMKRKLHSEDRFNNLSKDQQNDIDSLIHDIMTVESIMNEHRIFDRMWCRFALRNDPMEEVPANSMIKNIENFRGLIPGADFKRMLSNQDRRAVVGFCWKNKNSDWLTKTGSTALAVMPKR